MFFRNALNAQKTMRRKDPRKSLTNGEIRILRSELQVLLEQNNSLHDKIIPANQILQEVADLRNSFRLEIQKLQDLTDRKRSIQKSKLNANVGGHPVRSNPSIFSLFFFCFVF